MNYKLMMRLIGYWPPYLGTGISVCDFSEDYTFVKVQMKMRFWNRNYVGTHFGGSLYSMTDPFYMLMLLRLMGRDYIVWDKNATIRYQRPSRGTVYAHFEITPQQVEEFRQQLEENMKIEPKFKIDIVDSSGAVVAVVDKTLHIQKKSVVR